MAKRELLASIQDRYRGSSRKDKSKIRDEFIAVTGHHRKHGIRLLAQPAEGGRGTGAVKGRRICGKRLKAAMPHLVEPMEPHGHLDLDPEVQARALSASAATLDRLLQPARATVASRRNLRRRFFSLAGGLTRKARRLTLHLPLGQQPVRQSPVEPARPASPLLATPTASRHPAHYPIVSPSPAPGWPPAAVGQADIALRRRCGRQHPFGATTTPGAQLDWGRIKAAPSLSGSSHPLLRGVARSLRWIWAKTLLSPISACVSTQR